MNQGLGIADVMPAALATGLFVSLCTITELPTPVVLGPSGSPTAAYVAVSGLTGLRAMKAPINPFQSPRVDETKSTGDQLTEQDEHVLLESYYPTITTANRADIDGTTYDIVTVEGDSQGQMTRMRVRLANI